jgi:hypothetical protein
MLVYCTNPSHKKFTKSIDKPEHRHLPKKKREQIDVEVEDPAAMCFVNPGGEHVTPRLCTCSQYRPPSEDRLVKRLPEDERTPYEKRYLNIVPPHEWRDRNRKLFGRVDPKCPIEEAHEPIDNNTAI